MRQLAACDEENEFRPRYKAIIDIGIKRRQRKLVEYFIEYYGQLTLKLLETKRDLLTLKGNAATDMSGTVRETVTALQDIKDICDKFTGQLFANDIKDLQADILEKLKTGK
jgi:hypothetical protein